MKNHRTPLVFDSQPLTRRSRTKEGYLLVPGLIAASDNVQPYFARELGLDKQGLPPNQVVRVFRPKAEVDKAVSSFDGLPVTLEHPTRMVNAKTWRTVARGESRNTRAVDSGLESDLLIRDETTIGEIEANIRKELSAGYDFHIELTPGSHKGTAYDAVASDFIGNHIAVTKTARGGHDCRVADAQPKGDKKMRVLVFDALLLGLPAGSAATQISIEDDAVASQVDSLVRAAAQARDAAVTERDAVITECTEKLEALARDSQEQLEALEAKLPGLIEAAAQDRASVLAGAVKLGLTLKAEGKDTLTLRREVLTEAGKDAGRKAVIDAMVPDLAKLDEASAKLATAALFAMDSGKKTPAKAHDALGHALTQMKVEGKDGTCAAPTGRAAMMNNSANAWRREGKK
jgi:uncharacterized protein